MTIRMAAIFAGITGFISLSYEILWFRVYSYSTGGSPVTFGLVLGVYLGGLAVGADIAGKFCKRSNHLTLERQRRLLGTIALAANAAGFLVIPAMAVSATIDSLVWLGLLAVAVAAGAFGGLLPLISNLGIAPDRESGEHLSFLYFANTAGAVIGSLFTGFVLTDLWSTPAVALGLSVAGLSLVLIAWWGHRSKIVIVVQLVVAMVSFAATSRPLFDGLYEKLQFKDVYHQQRFTHLVENRHGVIAVTNSGVTFGGGMYDGQISTSLVHDRNGIVRAYAAVALHPHPAHVLMIGLSTGAWAQVIANSADVDSLTIVEINPGYTELIGRYPQVSSLLHNPKVQIIIDDGRRWLVRNRNRKFDLIVSNTTFHFRANTTNLLSREFMQLVRAHLAPGGVFDFNTTGSQDAFKTAFSEFSFGVRVVNFVAVSQSQIVLDSTRWDNLLRSYHIDGHPVLDPSRAEDAATLNSLLELPSSVRKSPRPSGLETRESVLARIPQARVVTDDNMLPEWHTLVLFSSNTGVQEGR